MNARLTDEETRTRPWTLLLKFERKQNGDLAVDKVDSIWSGYVRDLELQGEISLFPLILHIFWWSELIRVDPGWSGLIRPGSSDPSRSGPTFVPACSVPSFFLTRTTGDAYGFLDSLTIPAASISWTAFLNSSSFPGGTLLYGCLNGTVSLRFISCCTTSVQPTSRLSVAKTWDIFSSNPHACAFCLSSSGVLLKSKATLGHVAAVGTWLVVPSELEHVSFSPPERGVTCSTSWSVASVVGLGAEWLEQLIH